MLLHPESETNICERIAGWRLDDNLILTGWQGRGSVCVAKAKGQTKTSYTDIKDEPIQYILCHQVNSGGTFQLEQISPCKVMKGCQSFPSLNIYKPQTQNKFVSYSPCNEDEVCTHLTGMVNKYSIFYNVKRGCDGSGLLSQSTL